MTLWLVRAGKAGEKEQCALAHGAALVGWEELPDLGACGSRDALQALLRATYPAERMRTLINWSSQLWPLLDTMQVGDLVALPLKARSTIAVGRVAGGYAYRTDLLDEGQHTRPVEWLAQIPRSAFDPDMLYSFGAFATVCRIVRNEAELRVRTMLHEGSWAPPDILRGAVVRTGVVQTGVAQSGFAPARLDQPRMGVVPAVRTRGGSNLRVAAGSPVPLTMADFETRSNHMIRERIAQKFKGHQLAELVGALLRAQGYTVQVQPPGPDGGVDILASRDALGFGAPRLMVQVKSQDAKVDVRVLRELAGVMGRFQADHGLLVGWGGFNQAVRSEAASAYFRLRLWDAEDVVRSVEEQYSQLPPAVRSEIPLRQVWTLASEGLASAA